MHNTLIKFGTMAALTFGLTACDATAPPVAKAFGPADIAGTYEMVERVMADGRVLKKPDIAALYTLADGRGNLNLFIRNPDGKQASESSILRYTLSDTQYCEWIEFTTRKDLDAPGVTNVAPPVTDHCTPIRTIADTVVFAPPGESVSTTWDRRGFTAVIPGQFTDHWRKIG